MELYDRIEPNARLKTGNKESGPRSFFLCASKLVEIEEGFRDRRELDDLVACLRQENNVYGILKKLQAACDSFMMVDDGSSFLDSCFYLMDCMPEEQLLSLRRVDKTSALTTYFEAEDGAGDERMHDFVLVKGTSIDDIRLCYPNYFGNISMFTDCITYYLS